MIKGGCQSGRKVVPLDSKSDLPLGSLSEACGQKCLLHTLSWLISELAHSIYK